MSLNISKKNNNNIIFPQLQPINENLLVVPNCKKFKSMTVQQIRTRQQNIGERNQDEIFRGISY